jgi:vancomycin resistance protein YoaR
MSRKHKDIIKINITAYFLIVLVVVVSLYFFLNKKPKVNNEVVNTPVAEVNEDPTKGLDLLGRAVSSYAGGTNGRHKNIELGVSKMNGKIILPGEEFSFKDTLGTTTIEGGYSEERVFLNGEVTKGVGGGLCQVSTALFRAAISSGLPITERSNHSFTVSLYDTGLDATYSDPGPDLKFKNDTGSPIVIKGKTEDLKAIFEIYGKKDGRIASTTEPEITKIKDILPTKYVWVDKLNEGQSKCVNTPQIGYTATVLYGVEYPNGVYKQNKFVSNYKPLQRICYIVGDEIFSFDMKKIGK